MLASLLVLVYVMSKAMPKVSAGLAGGERPHSSDPSSTHRVVLVRQLQDVVWRCWVVALAAHGRRWDMNS